MSELEATSVFYLLSTIAQVLACFISISAVFVFYKVELLRKKVKIIAHNSISGFKTMFDYNSVLDNSIAILQKEYENDSIDTFMEELGIVMQKFWDQTNIFLHASNSLDSISRVHRSIITILKFTRISVFTAIIGVFMCLITLLLVPWLSYTVLFIIMIISFLVAAFSLLAMMWVIFYSLQYRLVNVS